MVRKRSASNINANPELRELCSGQDAGGRPAAFSQCTRIWNDLETSALTLLSEESFLLKKSFVHCFVAQNTPLNVPPWGRGQ